MSHTPADKSNHADLSQGEVTQLLEGLSKGDREVACRIFPLLYDELRRLAGSYFRNQPADHTLQPTVLVNEAYLKLIESPNLAANDRQHFLAIAARAMRQILVDHARGKKREKRGGDGAGNAQQPKKWQRITLSDVSTPTPDHVIDLIALDEALTELAAKDERKARLIELRFFGGLTLEETSEALNIARSTASEEWRFARAWLSTRL